MCESAEHATSLKKTLFEQDKKWTQELNSKIKYQQHFGTEFIKNLNNHNRAERIIMQRITKESYIETLVAIVLSQ